MSDGILSIQSHVAFGHVGNSAAVFPLQRLGFEVWPVPTVLFSNHTGYGSWRGHMIEVERVREILAGIEERGAFDRCQAVLTGYLGDVTLGRAVIETVRAVRARRTDAIWLCDPVMGDVDRGFFVRDGIPAFFRDEALALADIITPNQFELAYLAGCEVTGLEDALTAALRLVEHGPRMVVVTSLEDTARPGQLGILMATRAERWIVWTPRLDIALNGTGDAFAALLLASWLRTHDMQRTLETTTAAMLALVEATHAAGSRELLLVAAQDQLVDPPRRLVAERLQ